MSQSTHFAFSVAVLAAMTGIVVEAGWATRETVDIVLILLVSALGVWWIIGLLEEAIRNQQKIMGHLKIADKEEKKQPETPEKTET